MTSQQLARTEHASWRVMLDALKAAGYITEADICARVTDRSSPQRTWIADSFEWLISNDDPHSLRTQFRQLFPDEIALWRFEQWLADAEALRRKKTTR